MKTLERYKLYMMSYWTPLFILIIVMVTCGSIVLAQTDLQKQFLITGRLFRPQIDEASGIACSTRCKDLFWIICDKGSKAVIYAVDQAGRDKGVFKIKGAKNKDWEDLAGFELNGMHYLLIADTGDNNQKRSDYQLYLIKEPDLRHPPKQIQTECKITFHYPDKSHDCEAIGVDTTSQTILLVTKRDRIPIVYSLPLFLHTNPASSLATMLAQVTEIPKPTPSDLMYKHGNRRSWPTAMDIRADSSSAVILTYKYAYLFQRLPNTSWKATFAAKPQTIVLPLPEHNPDLKQREAICFENKSNYIYITSEGVHAAIGRIGPY